MSKSNKITRGTVQLSVSSFRNATDIHPQIGKLEVEAWLCDGLALHKPVGNQDKAHTYVLTHCYSGQQVAKVQTNRQRALQWLEYAASIVDWTQELDVVKIVAPVYDEKREAFSRVFRPF